MTRSWAVKLPVKENDANTDHTSRDVNIQRDVNQKNRANRNGNVGDQERYKRDQVHRLVIKVPSCPCI